MVYYTIRCQTCETIWNNRHRGRCFRRYCNIKVRYVHDFLETRWVCFGSHDAIELDSCFCLTSSYVLRRSDRSSFRLMSSQGWAKINIAVFVIWLVLISRIQISYDLILPVNNATFVFFTCFSRCWNYLFYNHASCVFSLNETFISFVFKIKS